MIVLGLTGSIGMGKSTTAEMFAERGVPVFDSDAAVHRLYAGRAAPAIEAAFPGTTTKTGVDREKLAKAVLGNPAALARLEAIVHPMVREERERFLAASRAAGADIVLLDIPLLFESGGGTGIDRIVVVTASPEEQRRRVLARPGMTVEKFEAILARQMSDAEKRRRADFIVDTGGGLEVAARQVDAIIVELRQGDEMNESGAGDA
jgi:dephospho-CoA kinase